MVFLTISSKHCHSQILAACREEVLRVDGVKDVKLSVAAPKKFASVVSQEISTLAGVGHVIGVSSCKGIVDI